MAELRWRRSRLQLITINFLAVPWGRRIIAVLSMWRSTFNSTLVHVGFEEGKLAMGPGLCSGFSVLPHNIITPLFHRYLFSYAIRSRVQKFPSWHTKAAPNGKCCEGYIVPSMVRLMYQLKSKGRLCWKIAKLFYFRHLKMFPAWDTKPRQIENAVRDI